MIGVVFFRVGPVTSLSTWFSGQAIGVLKMFFTVLFSTEFNLYGYVCVVVDVDSVVVVVVEDVVVDVVVEVVLDVVDVEVVVDVVTIL